MCMPTPRTFVKVGAQEGRSHPPSKLLGPATTRHSCHVGRDQSVSDFPTRTAIIPRTVNPARSPVSQGPSTNSDYSATRARSIVHLSVPPTPRTTRHVPLIHLCLLVRFQTAQTAQREATWPDPE